MSSHDETQPRLTPSGTEPLSPSALETLPGEGGTVGPYRIVKELGKGGMGAVFLALDTRLDREVALKVMLPAFAADPLAKERFLREAKAVAKVAHDHVVTIHEADERDGVPYIAMQFLKGYPLDEFLKKKGAPSLAHCVRIVREAALGLAAAHKRGLVHRDIKPANLWLEAPNGRVKVLDFGLAKPVGSDSELTKSGAVVGTPAYMSPEQAGGQKVDHRTDIFSLGTLLYRLLTGRTPFNGEHIMAVLTALAVEEPTPVRELNPKVPPALAALVHQMLAKKPEARPQTATEVAERLRTALAQAPSQVADQVGDRVPDRAPDEVSDSVPVALDTAEVPQTMQVSAVQHVVVPPPLPPRAARRDPQNEETEAEAERRAPPARGANRTKLYIVGGAVALLLFLIVMAAIGARKKPGPGESPGPIKKVGENGGPTRLAALKGHSSHVSSVAYSADGTRIASASGKFGKQGEAKVWDANAGTEVCTLRGHEFEVLSATFSRDGTRVVTGGADDKAKVWDAATGAELLSIEVNAGNVSGVAFSPDGTRIVTANGRYGKPGEAKGYMVPGGKPGLARPGGANIALFTLKGHAKDVNAAAYNPTGTRIVTGSSDRTAKVWDANTGAELLTLARHSDAVLSVAYSADGTRIVTAGSDNTAKMWDANTGAELLTIRGHSGAVLSATFSADGTRIVTGSLDKTAKVWDTKTGAEVFALTGFAGGVVAAFSPDGTRIVTGSGAYEQPGEVVVWDVSSARPSATLPP